MKLIYADKMMGSERKFDLWDGLQAVSHHYIDTVDYQEQDSDVQQKKT
jgi:hypothetical protein